jgi:GNAT superfamily N-acetyltransferase
VNDAQVSIRSATPRDGERLRAMFARSSAETIYLRFHIPFPEVPEWMIALMSDTDHQEKEALVSVAEGRIVGYAMYVRLGEGTEAEMAIIVEGRWQSKGVGKALLSELAHRAGLQGIETFTAEVLETNRPMLALVAMFTGTGYSLKGGVCHLRVPLRMASEVRTLHRAE